MSGAAGITVLDQRARTASGVEARLMFTGRSLTGGLRPGAGTILFPGEGDQEGGWTEELGEGVRWTGNRLLPTRQKVRHNLLSDRETSRRLEVVWGEAGPSVSPTARRGSGPSAWRTGTWSA